MWLYKTSPLNKIISLDDVFMTTSKSDSVGAYNSVFIEILKDLEKITKYLL